MVMTKRVFKAALVSSLPVLMGYLTMGMAAGILLADTVHIADKPLWAFLTSAVNISGALQFLIADWIGARTPFTDIVLLTFCLNVRYAMYGFSLLDRFRGLPLRWKCYLIWTLTDETYALEVENRTPPGEDSATYCLLVARLDHFYWVAGVVAGVFAGANLPFPTRGIDFAMTALFIVILVDQCRDKYNRVPALIGGGAAFAARWFFSTGSMLIPAIALMFCVFIPLRKKLLPPVPEKAGNA